MTLKGIENYSLVLMIVANGINLIVSIGSFFMNTSQLP